MGYKNGAAQLSVIELLERQPQLFSYEQCISILEKKYNIRFKCISYFSDTIITCSVHKLSLSAYDINNITLANDNARIYAERMSITSLSGPLPNVYTEQISVLKWVKNDSLSDFMNIFTNRLSYLSYKISVRIYFSLQNRKNIDTNVGQCLNALAGSKNDERLIQYAYMLWNIPRSALGLRLIILNYFKVDVHITQFIGAFTEIEEVTMLGKNNCTLGCNAFLGHSYFNYENGIKITLGPLDNEQLYKFSPGGTWNSALKEVISSYLDKDIDYTLELIPKTQQTSAIGNSKLGYLSWLSQAKCNSRISDIVEL